MATNENREDGATEFTSDGVTIVEWRDTDPAVDRRIHPIPITPDSLLALMRMRVRHHGTPLPEGFVPPPGIDLDALLKLVPWPPTGGGATA
jgi:hypothetical protein